MHIHQFISLLLVLSSDFEKYQGVMMGMRIGSSNAMAMQSTSLSQANQKQQHVSNLFTALGSGDLASAQKSYTALGLSAGTSATNSPLAQIGKALDSGDLSSAQEIAKSMKAKESSASASTAAAANTNATTATTATTNSSINSQQTIPPKPSTTSDLASELMSDFTSASKTLGLGTMVNALV